MADLLSTAVSALQTYRRGLDTTGHNIANVGTEGYSRQRTQTATREAQPYGNGWVGSGVSVTGVQRVYDEFVALQARSSSSSLEQQASFAALAERVSGLYADTGAGLSATLQKFTNALQGVATAPSSMSARQVLLAEADALATRMNDYGVRLVQLNDEVNQRLSAATSEVNAHATAIADLNAEIVTAANRTGQPPNDLLDQRDRLIDQLASQVAVTTLRQDDGSLNVFVGTGQPLVLGSQPTQLVTLPDPFEASRVTVAVRTPAGPVDVTRNLTGGTIGGLVEFRSAMLDPARNALGQLAVGVAGLVNSQQAAGIDLNGAMGPPLFAVGDVAVLPSAANGGSATLAATRADAAGVTSSDYVLARVGGAWALRNASTGAAVSLSGTGSPGDPFLADGISLVVTGAAQDGDQFLIQPTRGAADGMRTLFSDPARLAAALPVIAGQSAANLGSARPGELRVADAGDPNLRTAATIQFTSAATYSINGGPPQAFTPGQPIAVNGWSLSLDGTPVSGDIFTVRDNSSGVGDNRNVLALVDRLSQPYLDGGTTSLRGVVDRVVADVGVQTRQAQISRDALAIVQRDAVAARDSVSGVNLDEEAADMIRYQQAYQAAAQVVQVANATFDALLGAIRR